MSYWKATVKDSQHFCVSQVWRKKSPNESLAKPFPDIPVVSSTKADNQTTLHYSDYYTTVTTVKSEPGQEKGPGCW